MDTISIGILATNVVAALAPFLAKGADVLVSNAAEGLYETVKARFSQKPAAAEALEDLEKDPDDADLQAAVRAQLKKIMAEDEGFNSNLDRLYKNYQVESSQHSVSASGRGVAAGRDIHGTVITGDVGGNISVQTGPGDVGT